jgi:mannosyltransferase
MIFTKRIDTLLRGKEPYLLPGILILSFLLRFYHIDYQSLWLDELFSIVPTDPQVSLSSIIEYCKSDQPPLFFIYLHYAFKLFTYSELVGRMACALMGLLGILSIYFLGKECQGKTAGLLASFLTGINYFHIYYSQELRFYGMAFLFATLSYLFFIRAFKRNNVFDFLGYSIFTICLLYTQYFGLIIFGTQGLSFLFLLFYKRNLKFILLSITSGIIILLAFIPWIPVIMNDMSADLGWIKSPEPFFVAQYFYDYTGKDAVTTLVFLVFIYFFVKPLVKGSISKEARLIYLVLIIWIAFSYLVPYVRSVIFSPMLNNRYTIVTLPAWLIVFAIGWDQIRNMRWKYSLPLILLLSFLVNMTFFKKHYTRIQKSQFREASEIVLSRNKSHYPIYSSLPWHYNFYFRKSEDKVMDLNKVAVSHVEKFWLLQAHFSENQMEDEVTNLRENFSVIEKHPLYEANAILMGRK